MGHTLLAGCLCCCFLLLNVAVASVAAAAVAVADVKTVRSDVAAAAAGDADADHVGRGGEWAAPRPPGQSFADCTAADLTDGAGSCERAAAMRATSELQLSMAVVASFPASAENQLWLEIPRELKDKSNTE